MVVILKMSNGDEVIANQVSGGTSNSMVSVSKPRVIMVTRSQDGQMLPQIMPWIVTAPDADIGISMDHVVTILDAPVEIERMYLQHTSGIALS